MYPPRETKSSCFAKQESAPPGFSAIKLLAERLQALGGGVELFCQSFLIRARTLDSSALHVLRYFKLFLQRLDLVERFIPPGSYPTRGSGWWTTWSP